MVKTWYNKTSGAGAVFDDNANISDWPDFQADAVAANATQVRAQRDALLAASDHMALAHLPTGTARLASGRGVP
jgi:hypothetical protein